MIMVIFRFALMELSITMKNIKRIPGPKDEVQSWNFPECNCGNIPLRQPSIFISAKCKILLVTTRHFSVFKFQICFRLVFSLTLQ
jgi:hypothetical protein